MYKNIYVQNLYTTKTIKALKTQDKKPILKHSL